MYLTPNQRLIQGFPEPVQGTGFLDHEAFGSGDLIVAYYLIRYVWECGALVVHWGAVITRKIVLVVPAGLDWDASDHDAAGLVLYDGWGWVVVLIDVLELVSDERLVILILLVGLLVLRKGLGVGMVV